MTSADRGNGQGNGAGQTRAGAITFPVRFDIKAMGRQNIRFEALVQGIISRHTRPEDLIAVRTRPSRGRKYVALTVTITAHSQEQLDAIYRDLSACDEVLVAL